MVAKKKARTLKSKEAPHYNPRFETTVMSTVGVGDGWGVTHSKEYQIGTLIDRLISDGLDGHSIAAILKIYEDAKDDL